jgi:transcriptional antiterminator RfaH
LLLNSQITHHGMDNSAQWFAVYTRSRTEKKIAERLAEKGIESYVPLRKVMKQWSDRRKVVEEPLIRSYVFVNILPSQYFEVLNTPGAVRYVYFDGKPAAIPERQIEALRMITGKNIDIHVIPDNFPPGTLVKIISGPLFGLTGELIHHSGKNHVVIRIDHLKQALLFTISPLHLEAARMN